MNTVFFFSFQAMVGILQGKETSRENALMQDLKPFRILISLLDKPELGIFPPVLYYHILWQF